MSSYVSVQVQIFKDDVEIVRYQEDDLDVKFYSDDDIVEFATSCLTDNVLYNETGLFTVDLVFYRAHSSAMSTRVHMEQASVVQIVSTKLDEVHYGP